MCHYIFVEQPNDKFNKNTFSFFSVLFNMDGQSDKETDAKTLTDVFCNWYLRKLFETVTEPYSANRLHWIFSVATRRDHISSHQKDVGSRFHRNLITTQMTAWCLITEDHKLIFYIY